MYSYWRFRIKKVVPGSSSFESRMLDNFLQVAAGREVQRVFDKYMDLHNASKDTGISALIRAGVARIQNEKDIRYIVSEIQNKTGSHPFDVYSEQMKDINLVKFFKEIDEESLRESGKVESVINKLKK